MSSSSSVFLSNTVFMRSCKHSIDLPHWTSNSDWWRFRAAVVAWVEVAEEIAAVAASWGLIKTGVSWSGSKRQITIKHTALSKLNVVILSSCVLTANVFWLWRRLLSSAPWPWPLTFWAQGQCMPRLYHGLHPTQFDVDCANSSLFTAWSHRLGRMTEQCHPGIETQDLQFCLLLTVLLQTSYIRVADEDQPTTQDHCRRLMLTEPETYLPTQPISSQYSLPLHDWLQNFTLSNLTIV